MYDIEDGYCQRCDTITPCDECIGELDVDLSILADEQSEHLAHCEREGGDANDDDYAGEEYERGLDEEYDYETV